MRPDQILAHAQNVILLSAEPEHECGYCGYIESACICDHLCFYRTFVTAQPCLEPKEHPSDPVCKHHVQDLLRDESDAIHGGVAK